MSGFKVLTFIFFAVLNINGNLVQIAGAPQAATTNNAVAQTTVASPTSQQVVPQTLTTVSPNQLAMANGNIVMVRSATDVRNTLTVFEELVFHFSYIKYSINY